MRTFHTGGVAGGDITQGLPRVEELFEARTPKGMATISEIDGVVELRNSKKKQEVVVTNPDTGRQPHLPDHVRFPACQGRKRQRAYHRGYGQGR